jgi:hypothetical protein
VARKVAPPFNDTVQKFAKDSGKSVADITAAITNFAANYGENGKNLDVMAWLYVQNQGMSPPALQASSVPFSTLDKPYITLAEALKADSPIGENTGFNVRGWVLGDPREGKSSTGGPAMYITLADGSATYDINIYGKQVDSMKSLGINMFDAIFIKNCQKHIRNQNGEALTSPRLQVSGTFSEAKKIKVGEYDLVSITDIPPKPLDSLKPYETAYVKGMVFDTSQREYSGCPHCMKKFSDKIAYGRPATCPGNSEKGRASCGDVIATRLVWTEIQINDMTGELTMSFSPSFEYTEEQLKAMRMKTVVAIGYLEPENNKLNARYLNTEENFYKMMGASTAPKAQVPSSTSTQPSVTVTAPHAAPATITTMPTTPATASATPPAPTATTSEMSSLPPSSAVAPILESWVRLMGPKTEAEIIKFLNEKKKIPTEAIKLTLKEMIDVGAVVSDNGKIRLA